MCVCVYRGCPVKCVLIQYFVNLHIQCTTASLPLTEELLFVRKAQAIVDFCLECRSLLKAFKLDISVPEGACCYTLSESVIWTYCSFVSLLPYQYAVCIFNPHFTLHHRQHYRFQSPHSSWCPKQEAVCSPRSFRDHPWLPNTALHLRDPHLSRPRPALSLSRLLSYLCHYRVPGHSIAQKADTNGRCLQTGRWNIFKGGRQWHTVPCAAKLLI